MRKIKHNPPTKHGHRYWTPEEVKHLIRFAHLHTMAQLVESLQHSDIAIWRKCRQLGLSRARYDDGYTLKELANGLECNIPKANEWIRNKWLIGTRQGPNAKIWNFKDADIAAFLRAHPDQVSKEVMNSLWVQDILYESFEYGMGPLVEVC